MSEEERKVLATELAACLTRAGMLTAELAVPDLRENLRDYEEEGDGTASLAGSAWCWLENQHESRPDWANVFDGEIRAMLNGMETYFRTHIPGFSDIN